MALPASDGFSQSSGSTQALATYSASWTVAEGSFNVPSGANAVAAGTLFYCSAYWNADTFSADQFSQVVITAALLSDGISYGGPAVRHQSGAVTLYHAHTNGSSVYVGKSVAGTKSDLAGPISQTFAAGDVFKMEVSGTGATVTLKLYRAPAATPTVFTQFGGDITDSAGDRITAAGAAGFFTYDQVASGNCRLANWQGGNLAGAAVPIGQVTETDTAQSIAVISPIVGTIGQVTETDSAQPLYQIDFAQAEDLFTFGDDTGDESSMGGLKLFGGFPAATSSSITIGQPAETDSAQPMVSRQLKAIGQPSEADTAQPMSVRVTVTIGQPAETDSAQPLASPQARAIGQPSETDTAQAFASPQARAIGQPAEADTAQAMAIGAAGAMGQPVETDTAQPLTARQLKGIGQPAETDTAQPLTAAQARAIGQPSETDTAQAMAQRQVRTLGQPVETDTAQGMTSSVPGSIGQALEADAAQPMTARQLRAIGQPAEIDTAQPVTRGGISIAIGQPSEADAAQAFVARLLQAIGQPLETDTAQPATRVVARTVGQPSELDTAFALSQRQLRAIGIAVEFDSALALGSGGTPGLVYVAGRWQYKATPAPGDLLLFLGPDGLVHAKTAAGAGDRRLTSAAGQLQAGAPA